LTRKQGCGWFT